jgi:hypothetical protein
MLILVHTDPVQVARLVARLTHPRVDFFIHVDRRSDLSGFSQLLPETIQFVRNRHRVSRKGWSMVAATLELMKESLKEEYGGYRTLTLLSGVDYPLVSVSSMVDSLDALDEELIDVFQMKDNPKWFGHVNRRHYMDDAAAEGDPGLRGISAQVVHRVVRATHKVKFRAKTPIEFPPLMQMCGGAQWWTMSGTCASYVSDEFNRREIRTKFRFARSPCEVAIQTVVYNSPFQQRITGSTFVPATVGDVGPQPSLTNVFGGSRYVDWSDQRWTVQPDGSGPRGPALLDDRDFGALQSSVAIFARKFDRVRSASLLNRIDRELLDDHRF